MKRLNNKGYMIVEIIVSATIAMTIAYFMMDLIVKLKEIDVEDVKEEFDKKLAEIKEELDDLDKEKVLKIAEIKAEELKDKAEELVNLAVEKGTPVLRDAAEEVRKKAVAVTKDVLKKLQTTEKTLNQSKVHN